MITYEQAASSVGHPARIASFAGGWARRAKATLQPGGEVTFRLYRTDIVTVYPDGAVRLYSGGWHTPSTFDGMGAITGIRPFRDRQGYLMYGEHRYGDGMIVNADGTLREPGAVLESSHDKIAKRDRQRALKALQGTQGTLV